MLFVEILDDFLFRFLLDFWYSYKGTIADCFSLVPFVQLVEVPFDPVMIPPLFHARLRSRTCARILREWHMTNAIRGTAKVDSNYPIELL